MDNTPPGQISDRPLREANTRGSRHITGTILGSAKNCHIDWTGQNERQFAIRAVIDPRVTRILCQPVWYDVLDGEGSSFRAFPDFLIEIDGVAEIHEVKPDAEYSRPDVRHRLELTARAADRHGHRYAVTLASDLHRKIDQPAIDAVWRRTGEIDDVDASLLLAVDDLLAERPMTIAEACARLPRQGATIHQFHALIAGGRVVADRGAGLIPSMPPATMSKNCRPAPVGTSYGLTRTRWPPGPLTGGPSSSMTAYAPRSSETDGLCASR